MKLKCIHHKQFIETKASNSSGEYTLTKSSSITCHVTFLLGGLMMSTCERHDEEECLNTSCHWEQIVVCRSCVSEQHVIQCQVLNSWMCAIASVQKVKLSSPVLLHFRCIPRFHPKAKYLKLFGFGFNVITPSYWLTCGPPFTHPPPPHPPKKSPA